MAISFVNASGAGTTTTGGATSLTFNHITSNANELLMLAVACRASATTPSIVYSGASVQNFTLLNSLTSATPSKEQIWYLKNPQTGTNAINLTWTTANKVAAVSQSYAGVDLTTTFGASISGTVNSATPNLTLTTTKDGSYIYNAFMIPTIAETYTASAPNTLRKEAASAGNSTGSNTRLDGLDRTTTTAGSYNVSGTYSSAVIWIGWAQELLAGGGGTTGRGYIIA